MATYVISKEHVTCPICSDVYVNPYALKCLHTFCLDCIKRTEQQQKAATATQTLSCPTCYGLVNTIEIKKDFKTKGFVDLYHEQQAKFSARRKDRKSSRQKSYKEKRNQSFESTGRCEMCNGACKVIKSKCLDCNQVMCEDCAITHRGISACQNHKVLPIKDVIKMIQSDLGKTITELEKDKQNMVKKCKEIKEHITDVKKCHANQLSEVNRQVDGMIVELEKYRKWANETVNVENYSFLEDLKSGVHVYETCQNDIQGDLDFLSELVESADVSALVESAKSVEASIQYDANKLKENLPKVDSQLQLPVTLEMGSLVFDPRSFLTVKLEKKKLSFKKMAQSLVLNTSSTNMQHFPNEEQRKKSPARSSDAILQSHTKIETTTKHAEIGQQQQKPRDFSNPYVSKNRTTDNFTKVEHESRGNMQSSHIAREKRSKGKPTNKNFGSMDALSNTSHPMKVDQSPQQQVKGAQSSPDVRQKNTKSPLSLAKSLPLERRTENVNYFRPSIDSVFTPPPKYAEAINYTYKYEKGLVLPFYPQRLCVIKSNVWIAGWDGVYVFDKHGQQIKSIKHPKLQLVRGIVQTHNEDILVACAGNKGLFKLDSSGKFRDRVAYGSFTDICLYKKWVYALDNELGKVLVFELKSKQWKKFTEFGDIKHCERISVNFDTIFVSSREHHKLSIYNLAGRLLYSTGQTGSKKPGMLKHPLLCDVNNAGDALIADCDNHRLQVRYQNGDWRILTLPGDIRWPVDAVVDQKASTIWVIKHEPATLLKFSRKHASMNDLLDINF